MLQAVVFDLDLDGVLLDSERLWGEARRAVTASHGAVWRPGAAQAMRDTSSSESSVHVREELGDLADDERGRRTVDLVVAELLARYERALPLLPGALDVVRRLAAQWPIAVASSSNRGVVDRVLDLSGLRNCFAVTMSSEDSAHGKPSPDVHLAAARALDAAPEGCAAIEGSANGIRAAIAARMHVVVVPNLHVPPPSEVLGRADLVVGTLRDVTVEALGALGDPDVRVDEQERESFPASDPHSDWAGPGH